MKKPDKKSRWPLAPAILLLIANVVFLFWPWISGGLSGKPRYFEWDVPEQYWADLQMLCTGLSEGELPLWNPHDRAGYPAYADPQAGLYHPLNWALCATGGSKPSLFWTELRVPLGFLLAGLFGIMWLRRLGLDWGPALLGATLIQAAPFMRHNWELNLTLGLAHLPLMLWAVERAVVEQRLRDSALVALALGLCTWTGSPPALWQASLFVFLYAVWRLVGRGKQEGLAESIRALRTLLFGLLLAIPLVAVVILPGLQLSSLSVQAGRDAASIAQGSLEADSLLALLWPQPGNHLYLGWIGLVLSLLALLGFRLGRRFGDDTGRLPGRSFFAVAIILGVLLALGENGFLFGLLAKLPGFGSFRLPLRYEAWLGPAAGALAAGGLSLFARKGILDWAWSHRPVLFVAVGANLVVAAVWIVLFPGLGPAMLLIGMAFVALFLALPRLGAGHVLLGMLLSAGLLVDVSQEMPPERHTVEGVQPTICGAEQAERILALLPEEERAAWRGMAEFGLGCRAGTRLGLRDLRGYQDPLQLKAYERLLSRLRHQPRLAEQFNLRWALTGPHFIHGWNRHFLPKPEELLKIDGAKDLGSGVIELPRPMPFAYFVPMDQAVVVPDRQSALEKLAPLAPAPLALLDRGADGPDLPPELAFDIGGREAKAPPPDAPVLAQRELTISRNTLRLSIEVPSDGVVVINEAWYPGWSAKVSGQDVPILRANGLVRAVQVPKGMNLVEMEFAPLSATILRWLLLAGWLALAVIGVITIIQNRNAPKVIAQPLKARNLGPAGPVTQPKARGFQTLPVSDQIPGPRKR